MNVIPHYTSDVQFIRLMLVPVNNTFQHNVSFVRQQLLMISGRKSDRILCPWSLEVRKATLAVADVFRRFRRGVGNSTRGACAPRTSDVARCRRHAATSSGRERGAQSLIN